MPIHKSAIKKVRQDKKRNARNLLYKKAIKNLIRGYNLKPDIDTLKKVQSALLRAAKKHVIHKNTASRLLSRIIKNLPKKSEKKTTSKPRRKTT